MLALYHVTRLVFPGDETLTRQFLQGAGVDPSVITSDKTTPHGWALWVAQRYVMEYVEKSGWNVNGLENSRSFPYTGKFPRRFTDTTQYKPVNPGHLPPGKLRYPLRWQPLTQMVDSVGDWATQVHITPHIGIVVKPLSFTTKEWLHLKPSRMPFKRPNCYRRISKKDRATLQRKLVPHMLRRMRNVFAGDSEEVRRKLFRIRWWDNKFVSLGGIGVAYEHYANISRDNVLVTGLGETMALHDAVVLAFREKVSNDLARPETIIRHLYHNMTNKNRIPNPRNSTGNETIPVDEFQTLIRTMPHSEFPSASAVLCSAVTTYIERQVTWRTNGTFRDTGYEVYYPKGVIPFFPEGFQGDVRVKFPSIKALAKDCGASRVAAGLHFQPSVDEGHRLGRVVGEKTFETFRDLEEGRIPKRCHWCLRG